MTSIFTNVIQSLALDNNSTLQFLWKGGIIMVPLMLCSIIGLYKIIEGFIKLMRARGTSKWRKEAYEKLEAHAFDQLYLMCMQQRSIEAHVLKVGLQTTTSDMELRERMMEVAANEQFRKLEEGLSTLGSIAGGAPMLGFLGTVTGMIQAFNSLAHTEYVTPQVISAGLYEAMITTAAGLFIGIPAYYAYNYLVTRHQRLTGEVEDISNRFLNAYKISKTKEK